MFVKIHVTLLRRTHSMRATVLRATAPPRLASRLVRQCSSASEVAALRRELEQVRRDLAKANERAAVAAAAAAAPAAAAAATAEKSYFVGASGSEYTPELKFWDPHRDAAPPVLPVFRLMDDLGQLVPGAEAVPALNREESLAMLVTMMRTQEFDKIFLDAQRQGRVPFYLTSRGEEAAAVGSAAALHPTDWMLPQYREMGALFWRGFSFEEVANQLVANSKDTAHGRQLGMQYAPCPPGWRSHLGPHPHRAFGTPLHAAR